MKQTLARIYLSGWTHFALIASTFAMGLVQTFRGDPHVLFFLAAVAALTWVHEFSHAAVAEYYGWTWYMRYSRRTNWNPAVKAVPPSCFYQRELARIAFAPIIPTLTVAVILTPMVSGGMIKLWMLPAFAIFGSIGDYLVTRRELVRERTITILARSLERWPNAH